MTSRRTTAYHWLHFLHCTSSTVARLHGCTVGNHTYTHCTPQSSSVPFPSPLAAHCIGLIRQALRHPRRDYGLVALGYTPSASSDSGTSAKQARFHQHHSTDLYMCLPYIHHTIHTRVSYNGFRQSVQTLPHRVLAR